MFDRY